MQAQEIPITEFLNKGEKFIIPVYQRNYDWKRKQCEQMLKDIDEINSDQLYFIGSIVHKRKNNLITNPELVIIDGQQRITTLTLFLFRIAEILKENNDIISEQIWDSYIQNKYDNSAEKLKLKPIVSDFEVFKNLINGNLEAIPDGNRILDNYLFFKEKITSYKQAKKLYDNFTRLTIVEIALSNEDDPQKIFQSLNSTGLALSQADLIRNYLLMNLDYGYQEKIFQNYWSIIEKNCIKTSINESNLSDFFRDYLTFKFNFIPSYNSVFETFKEKYSNINDSTEIFERELEEMREYSNFYRFFINPEQVTNKVISTELKNLDKQEVKVSYPLLLGVFMDFKNDVIDEKTLVQILKLIQSFVFRRFICGVPTNALNKIFMSLYNNSKKLREKNDGLSYLDSISIVLTRYTSYQRFPTDDEVIENLKNRDVYSTQSKNKLYLLERLENEYDKFVENNIDLFDKENISIEHIFPQNPSEEWKKTLSAEEFAEMEEKRNTLGNLTIVINNSSLGNRSFLEKRDLNQDASKGYRYSHFKLNEYLSDLEEWNTETLKTRTDLLSKKFVNIWKYPEISYVIEEEPAIEVEISDIEDPTGKVMSYYSLNGVKSEDNSFIGMYTAVLQHLYKENFELLFSPEMKEIFTLSTDPKVFLQAREIEGGYYTEANMGSRSIVNKLKAILELVDESIELRVCFQEDKD